jgi:hypothetical protein
MKKFAKNTGLFFVMTLLILATGGVPVYHHLCHCAGEMTSAVYLEPACEHGSATAACCHEAESHSCCMAKESDKNNHACHEGDCCETDSQFIKIQDSYQPVTAKFVLKPIMAATELFIFDLLPEKEINLSQNILIHDLPPPESGKQIVVALHQLKLDHFVV